MEHAEFEDLVLGLQSEARERPGWFRFKLMAISISAYVLLFVLLAALLGLLVALGHSFSERHSIVRMLVLGSACITLLPILWVVLRALFMRLGEPVGVLLTPEDAPRLFEILGKIRKKLGAPPLDRVVIDDAFNACITQQRRGLFGTRNTLVIGLPLMLAMSPSELVAVLAHEYGHIGGNHGRVSAWIYRQRRTFGDLQEHVQDKLADDSDSGLHALLARALAFFAEHYNAYTFVLARDHEYEADAAAARVAGAPAAASGLIRGRLVGAWLSNVFWPELYRQASSQPAPRVPPFSAMRRIIEGSRSEWCTLERLRQAWADESDVLDTHPCLRERVEALGGRCEPPAAVQSSAAEALLGKRAAELVTHFDNDWWTREKNEWVQHHRRLKRDLARIAELAGIVDPRPEEAQEYALLLAEHKGPAAALPVLAAFVERHGDLFAKPLYIYGRALLDTGNELGLTMLERAARRNPGYASDCAQSGYEWLSERRGDSEARRWLTRFDEAVGN
ncbi:M48 family metallopeptidase [Chitinibacteraceae bacterium HSL-7]